MGFGILDCFMISLICGAVFGLVYELFRIIRRLFPFGIVIMICDICFFVAAGFFVFELSMYLGNYVRLYTLLGFGTGIFVYIQTVGRLISLLENTVILVIKSVVVAVVSHITNIFGKVIGAFAHKVSGIFGRFYDFLKRRRKKSSSLLHFNTKRVYNVKRNIITSGENIGGNNVIQVKIRRGQ